MARALAAVGAALVFLLLVLGVVVYVNRDEDAIAVDNLLAENITREIGTAEQRGADVDLADVTDFKWDHVLRRRAQREPRRDLEGTRRAVEGRRRVRHRRPADLRPPRARRPLRRLPRRGALRRRAPPGRALRARRRRVQRSRPGDPAEAAAGDQFSIESRRIAATSSSEGSRGETTSRRCCFIAPSTSAVDVVRRRSRARARRWARRRRASGRSAPAAACSRRASGIGSPAISSAARRCFSGSASYV